MEVVFHPRYMDHRHFRTHPERPERLEGILVKLESSSLLDTIKTPVDLDDGTLSLVHTEDYLKTLGSMKDDYLDGGDTFVSGETYEIARMAVGGSIRAVEEALDGRDSMALLRPPGHHAGSDYGGGFCYLNNIAIAARHTGFERIAIVDIDSHHGNGTSDIFYRDPSVLYISTHHHGIYPGTGVAYAVGEDQGQGYNVNIPFPAGAGDSSLDSAWSRIIEPILRQYSPEMILVSLGTDGHYADVMTGLSISSQCYINTCKRLQKLSSEICDVGISFMLEGGYHIPSLAEVIAGVVSREDIELEFTKVTDNDMVGERAINDTAQALSKHWDL